MTRLFLLISISATVNFACYKDLDCHPDSVGEVNLTDATLAMFPLDTGKTLVFVDTLGNEMRFVCLNPEYARFNLAVELQCLHPDLSADYRTVSAEYIYQTWTQDSIFSFDNHVEFRFLLQIFNAKIEDTDNLNLYDQFAAYYGYYSQAADCDAQIEYIAHDRGTDPAVLTEVLNEQVFREIPDTTLLGKPFQDLLASKPAFGASPDDKYAFFYQKNVGPAAFSLRDGRVFIFDRAE